jgi:hypothetical protein
LDFDDTEIQGEDDIIIRFDHNDSTSANEYTVDSESSVEQPVLEKTVAVREPSKSVARVAPVVVSAIPVSFSESDFSDLNNDEKETESLAIVDFEQVALPSIQEPVSVLTEQATPAQQAPEFGSADVAASVKQVAPQTIANVEFIEPKLQQTGYVPVAPPSFSMPSTPNNGFDFTVRISPDNKAD